MKRVSDTARENLSVDELAEDYPISREWIYREVREGRLPHLRFGRRISVNRQEFEDYARRAAKRHPGTDLSPAP